MAKTPIKGLTHAPEDCTDERIIASSLMMGILGRTKKQTPDELVRAIADSDAVTLEKLAATRLTDEQVDILERNATYASYTRVTPTVSVVICEVCGEWLVSDGAVTKCQMTPKCTGRKDAVIKAKKASLVAWEE